ncbi:putative beta-ketoacyl-[acyl-carrier-protein] synthase III [Lupinus albus]|uniref:Putative beta-ketoacyl-[acyl-carrier-protein] synthase III n=1 Tax=Lupinus albus TaxID=3870 RepID=A0A6A4N9E1_LUPAL|nr:putative beta-ketoacyl-[acyl-carrier-protein] synthase III [Lupinus albus]
MANASGFFAPSVPNSTLRILPSMGIHQFQRFLPLNFFAFLLLKVLIKVLLLPNLAYPGCKLVGCGSSVPSLQISNDDLSKFVETSDEWISTLLAPESVDDEFFQVSSCPCLCNDHLGKDTLTNLAAEAARKALEMANVDPDDLDLILMCTSTPEDLFGSAPQIQKQLGCKTNPLAYDITAACSGFVLGLISAASHIRGSGFQNVLVVGADALSRYVDWTDRGSCILFGDAAGAVLVQACNSEEDGLFGFDVHSDGNGQGVHLNAAIKEKNSNNTLDSSNGSGLGFPPRQSSYSCIQMNGKEVFRFAVRCVPQSIASALEKAGLPASSVDWLLLHQANQRIIEAVATRLEVPSEREGQTIAVSGFGAGLSWGSAIIRWG